MTDSKALHLYENEHYMVFPNPDGSGYYIQNRVTGIKEGWYEKLASAITGADTTNAVLMRIYAEKAE